MRAHAADALGIIHGGAERAASAAAALAGAIEDDDEVVRRNAALSLARVGAGAGEAADQAAAALAAGLADESHYVRGYAVLGLRRLDTPRARRELLAYLESARWGPGARPLNRPMAQCRQCRDIPLTPGFRFSYRSQPEPFASLALGADGFMPSAHPWRRPLMRIVLLRTALAAAALTLATTPLFANQCDAYGEAPQLAALVASGDLPPVEERLPDNPLVVEPAEQIGIYGGEMFDSWDGGRLAEFRHYGYEPLVRWSVDGSEIIPNVAESWTISDDVTTYTFKLRKGMKWSDGMPFTARDILFWWERIETNTAINPSGPRGLFVLDGEHATVEAIDDHTIRFSWSNPYGVFLLNLATSYGQRVVQFAKHYAEQFDNEANPDGVARMMADDNADDYGRWWKATVGTYGPERRVRQSGAPAHPRARPDHGDRRRSAHQHAAQPLLLQGGHRLQSAPVRRHAHLGPDQRSRGSARQVAVGRDRHLAGQHLHADQPGGVLRQPGARRLPAHQRGQLRHQRGLLHVPDEPPRSGEGDDLPEQWTSASDSATPSTARRSSTWCTWARASRIRWLPVRGRRTTTRPWRSSTRSTIRRSPTSISTRCCPTRTGTASACGKTASASRSSCP